MVYLTTTSSRHLRRCWLVPSRIARPHQPSPLVQYLAVLLVLCSLVTSQPANSPPIAPSPAVTKCAAGTAQRIGARCFENATSKSTFETCATQVIEDSSASCDSAPEPRVKVLRILVVRSSTEQLERWRRGFLNATGLHVQFTQDIQLLRYFDEVMSEIAANVTDQLHDGWQLYPNMVPPVAEAGGLADLGPYITHDARLSWNDITAFSRERTATYDQTIRAMPLDADMFLMYYRADILDSHRLKPPRTWEEFVAMARQLNGTVDTDGDGQPDYSVCLDFAPVCTTGFMMMTIAASGLQHLGSSQGVFYDPATMEALANNRATARAMEYLAELRAYSASSAADQICQSAAATFAIGKCILSYGWADHFKMAQLSDMSIVANLTGVAQLPGSTWYLDRNTKQLANCTRATCPYAKYEQLRDGSTALVNRAPYAAAAGLVGGVSKLVSKERQDAAYKFWAYVAGRKVSFDDVIAIDSPTDAFRVSHMSSPKHWVARGYTLAATTMFLAATKASVKSKNVAMDLAIPSNTMPWRLMSETVDSYLANHTTVAQALFALQDGLDRLIASNPQRAEAMYKRYLGAPFPNITNTTTIKVQVNGTSHSNRHGFVATVVSAVVCGSLFLATIAAFCTWQFVDHRRTLFGRKVIAPGAGAESTLVVTDIQDSTALWEAFPADLMDTVLKEHHRIVRQLLLQHHGYESATEGDSFILGFHTAKDAVLFAAQLQQALLSASWPDELLAAPSCQRQAVTSDGELRRFFSSPQKLQHWNSLVGGWLCHVDGTGGRVRTQTSDAQLSPDTGSGETDALAEPNNVASRSRQAAADNAKTFKQTLLAALTASDGESRLLFRGLRVRVGMYSGINTADTSISVNPTTQRTQYAGEALVVAKAVCDAAQGGMVLLTSSTYCLLQKADVGGHILLLHSGSHLFHNNPNPFDVYQAVDCSLAPRLALLGPVRSERCLEVGAIDAPTGSVTVVFMIIVGAHALLAWNSTAARQSISMLQALASQQLSQHEGYMVEQTDDLVLATFQRREDAAQAALHIMVQGLHLPWPQELLEHPLGEELSLMGSTISSRGSYIMTEEGSREVLMRGLRLKAGLDTGPVLASLHPSTGRITYRGTVMNRAARIASTAGTGQVLGSRDSAEGLQSSAAIAVNQVGLFQLKGISQALSLYQFSLKPRAASSNAHQPRGAPS